MVRFAIDWGRTSSGIKRRTNLSSAALFKNPARLSFSNLFPTSCKGVSGCSKSLSMDPLSRINATVREEAAEENRECRVRPDVGADEDDLPEPPLAPWRVGCDAEDPKYWLPW